jgi:hypothetical protein
MNLMSRILFLQIFMPSHLSMWFHLVLCYVWSKCVVNFFLLPSSVPKLLFFHHTLPVREDLCLILYIHLPQSRSLVILLHIIVSPFSKNNAILR